MFDAIVLGGGIVGASTAYALTKTGQSVLLIDQFEPGHTHGSSHGDGRIVRFNYTEAVYVQIAKLAYAAWEALERTSGQTFLKKTGLVEYGPQGCAPIQESRRLLGEYGIPYEDMTPEEARRRFPQFAFQPNTDLFYQPDGAAVFATPAVKALWQLVNQNGTTRTGRRIETIDIQPEQVTLTDTQGESYQAARLVVAAGGWANKLLAPVGVELPLVVTQELLAYYGRREDATVSHEVGVMPVMIDYHDEVVPFYCLPQVEIPGVKVGWHHNGDPRDPDAAEMPFDHLRDGISAWVGQIFPQLVPEPIKTQTCLYTNTPDYHFVMDHHPEWSHVVVAAGFSGHGFKFGPALGDLLAALLMGDTPPVDLSPFRIARFDEGTLEKRVGA